MFTGLIHSLGKIKSIQNSSSKRPGKILLIQTGFKKLKKSESISVNGVCLTVIKISKQKKGCSFTAEVSEETLKKTICSTLKVGDRVNLEQSLTLTDRLGGHFVQGHVDGIGKIVSKKTEGLSRLYTFSYPETLKNYLIPKGSIAVNGISLTIVDITPGTFSVSILPYTEDNTTLGDIGIGGKVNLEADILAKIVSKQVKSLLSAGKLGDAQAKNFEIDIAKLLSGERRT